MTLFTDSGWLVGFLAGALTTTAFVPQVLKTWRSRSAADLSLGMLIVFTMGVALWIAYGLMMGAAPVIVSNVVTFGLAASLLAMKLRWE